MGNYDIEISHCPPLHSISNGQVKRLHSTLVEISRCIQKDREMNDTEEIILKSVIKYNKTVHLIIKERPIDVVHSRCQLKMDKVRLPLEKAQDSQLIRENKGKSTFLVDGKVVYKDSLR